MALKKYRERGPSVNLPVKVPVKVEQMNAYLFSNPTKITKNKMCKGDESIARSVPEIFIQMIEEGERLMRKRLAKEKSFKFVCRRQIKIRQTE